MNGESAHQSLNQSFKQVVQKHAAARRAWFDKLTITDYKACPEHSE
jgi:hypothetical protein